MRTLNFRQAVNEALHDAMAADPRVICYGLGVDDPKHIFGTTEGLQERFGSERVFDMPTAENAMTGVAIGAALGGLRPVMVHQRLDFFLLAMDQLVNSAAKWHFMFGGQQSVPITIRLILGRGWGQGPTHSQALHSWFNHVPGLKVVMPTTPNDAKWLLLDSIFDDNPVLFLEHRWLHNSEGLVSDFPSAELGRARVVRVGTDVTVIAASYMVAEAERAAAFLHRMAGILVEVIDVRSVKPLDMETLCASVCRTGRVVVADIGIMTSGFSADVVARVVESCFSALKAAPIRLALPDCPEPTSYGLTRGFHPGAREISEAILKLLPFPGTLDLGVLDPVGHHDVPGPWFKGPF